MRRFALLVTLVFALPLAAQTELGVHVAGAHAGSTDAQGTTLAFDRGRGFGASLEHASGEHLSYELAATSLRYDAALRLDNASANIGKLKLVPLTATARWHFAPRGESVDPYVGAGAAYVKASDLSSANLDALGLDRIAVESGTCWLANAGVAFHLRSYAVVVDGKYLDYQPSSVSAGTRVRLSLKPVVLSVGLRFKL
jgi:outer membrane protein W